MAPPPLLLLLLLLLAPAVLLVPLLGCCCGVVCSESKATSSHELQRLDLNLADWLVFSSRTTRRATATKKGYIQQFVYAIYLWLEMEIGLYN
jgi:hypothetical protein